MFWSDLVFGQKQGGNYEKPSRVSRLAAGAADARLLRPARAGRSERQYKWTRNYALFFSYRPPVAIVPIGISGVCPG